MYCDSLLGLKAWPSSRAWPSLLRLTFLGSQLNPKCSMKSLLSGYNRIPTSPRSGISDSPLDQSPLDFKESCPTYAYQVLRQWPTKEHPHILLNAFSHACPFSSVLRSANSSHPKASNYKPCLFCSLNPPPNAWLYLLTFWSRESTLGIKPRRMQDLSQVFISPQRSKSYIAYLLVNFSKQLPHTFYLIL